MSKDPDYPELRQRWHQVNGLTVQDLVDWCVHNGLAPDTVNITGAGLKWKAPETDDERARREQYEAQQRERQETWERETLARLKVKYPEAP